MSVCLTISQLLSSFKDVDKAFWASYSLDFNTVDFLVKNDLRLIMKLCYLHVIVDANQFEDALTKSLEKSQDLAKLTRLQEFVTFSTENPNGAFHPKILLLSSEHELHAIVGSANLTSSGILSNQDLVTVYTYSKNDISHKKEMGTILRYLLSYPGWCLEAVDDLNIVIERFPELAEETDSKIITSPGKISLMDRMLERLKGFSFSEIICYSPFYDDKFSALIALSERTNLNITAYTPHESVLTSLATLPMSLRIKTSKGSRKPSFHAKFYQFKGSNTSKIFWGSANCSFSALISNDRNYEFLIEDELENSLIASLWDDSLTDQDVVLVKSNAESNDISGNYLIVSDLRSIDSILSFCVTGAEDFRLVITNGFSKSNVEYESKNGRFSFIDNGFALLFWLEDSTGVKISNYCYINRPEKIASRLIGELEVDRNIDINRQDRELFKNVFEYFRIDQEKKMSKMGKALPINGFWRMPAYSRRRITISLIDLQGFINKEVSKIKESRDEENFFRQSEDKTVKQSLLKFISKEVSKLRLNLSAIDKGNLISHIDWTEWRKGLEFLVSGLMRDKLLFEDLESVDSRKLLIDLPLVITWSLSQKKEELEDDSLKDLFYIFLKLATIVASYDLIKLKRLDPLNLRKIKEFEEKKKVTVFMYLNLKKQTSLSNVANNYLRLLIEDLNTLNCFKSFITEAIDMASHVDASGLILYKNESLKEFLYIGAIDSQKMELMTLSGERKIFKKDAPLTKIILVG